MRFKLIAIVLFIVLLAALYFLPECMADVENIIEIDSFEALAAFSDAVALGDLTGAHVRLTADIVAERPLRPIGTPRHMFSGTFDGQGFTISRLIVLNPRGNAGLFGCIAPEGVVKNVTIEKACVIGTAYVGGVAGYSAGRIKACRLIDGKIMNSSNIMHGVASGGIAGLASGRIYRCSALNCTVSGPYDVGGIVGAFHVGVMRLCAFEGSVSCTTKQGLRGGLAGSLHGGARMRFCVGCCDRIKEYPAIGGAFSGSGAMGCLFTADDTPPFLRRLITILAAKKAVT